MTKISENLVQEVKSLSEKDMSDRQIAEFLSSKYNTPFNRYKISYIRSRFGIFPGGQMGRPSRIFQIFNEEGEMLFQGTTKECADYLDLTVSGVVYRSRHQSGRWKEVVKEVK